MDITTHTGDAFRKRLDARMEDLGDLADKLRILRAQAPKTHSTLRETLDNLLKTIDSSIPDIRFDAIHADDCACKHRLCKGGSK